MSVNTGRAKLYSSLKELRFRWERTHEQWNDSVSREFEENYWKPLESITVAAIAAMDHLEQVLLQIKQECGDDGTTNHEENATE